MGDDQGRVTVLLVEGDELEVSLFAHYFEVLAVDALLEVAYDGVEALEALRGQGGRRRVSPPCLVVLDLAMPDLDGYGLLREMRGDAALRPVPVVVVSTSGRRQEVLRAYAEFGVQAFLVKADRGNDAKGIVEFVKLYLARVALPGS